MPKPKKLRDGRTVTEWRFVKMLNDRKVVYYPLTENGKRYRRPSLKWYGQYKAADGELRRVPLCEGRRDAAQQELARLIREVQDEKAGGFDRFRKHRQAPLVDHLADWEKSLRANDRGEEYVRLKVTRVRALLDGCRFAFTTDIAADRVELFLSDLRQEPSPTPVVPPGVEWFRPKQVAGLLGVTGAAVTSLVRRHRLPAEGRTHGRRIPGRPLRHWSNCGHRRGGRSRRSTTGSKPCASSPVGSSGSAGSTGTRWSA